MRDLSRCTQSLVGPEALGSTPVATCQAPAEIGLPFVTLDFAGIPLLAEPCSGSLLLRIKPCLGSILLGVTLCSGSTLLLVALCSGSVLLLGRLCSGNILKLVLRQVR